MTNVSEWSTTADNNNGAPPAGAPENMLPGKVNDCIREIMASLAKWYQDMTGALVTGGTTTAYTVTTNCAHASLADIPLLTLRINAANTGACTLNVDGLGAKSLVKNGAGAALASGDLTINQLVVVAYNATADRFEMIGPAPSAQLVAPSGTDMLFVQAAAPTGWTLQSTHNNKALRLVTGGTGGSAAGTTAFTSVFASRTIAEANLPNVTKAVTVTDTRTYEFTQRDPTQSEAKGTGSNTCAQAANETETISMNSPASGSISGVTAALGSGTAMDFAVQYVDVIWAAKD